VADAFFQMGNQSVYSSGNEIDNNKDGTLSGTTVGPRKRQPISPMADMAPSQAALRPLTRTAMGFRMRGRPLVG
jgi:hypothetical protein